MSLASDMQVSFQLRVDGKWTDTVPKSFHWNDVEQHYSYRGELPASDIARTVKGGRFMLAGYPCCLIDTGSFVPPGQLTVIDADWQLQPMAWRTPE